ncbi:putative glyoxalase/Bleomycin resistance protein/Dihydroxybiphenyl dioxygenase [Helianthus annuus]|nr:putative glyoxalase/Bleomycin resistance protein/Dihydroxybiphenyl dioxygenase [Helianthus annuus]
MWEYYAKTLSDHLIFTRTYWINEARPHDKLPYRGAWLWVGSEMIHLMELPNPDPPTGRPEHGGRDRHTCIAIRDVSKLKTILDKAGTILMSSICFDGPGLRAFYLGQAKAAKLAFEINTLS